MDKPKRLQPSREFMEHHRELREASERVVSVTLDLQTAAQVSNLRTKENREMGK